MCEIKNSANEYAQKRYPRPCVHDAYSGARNGFIAGVNFAQKWNLVDQLLPPDQCIVLTKVDYPGVGFDITYDIALYVKDIKEWVVRRHYSNPKFKYIPTHWRPIEIIE